jgi:hypothetical protein
LAVAVGALVAVACTVETIQPYGSGQLAGTASAIVGAAGGIVSADDGTTVFIPPGALSGDVTITIGLDATVPDVTLVHPVTASHVFGPVGQTFAVPVCVTLSFEPGLLPQGTTENNVVLFTEVLDAGSYDAIPTLSGGPTQVMGLTTQFSTMFAAYGQVLEIAPDASDANCDVDQLDGLEEPE